MDIVAELVKAFVLPPAGPLIVALVGLALLRRAPRTGRALAVTGVGAVLLLALPVVAWWLHRPFQIAPLDLADARRAQAIVILGGGIRHHAPEYGGPTLGRLTGDRVRYGARVARATGLPVLVAGGFASGGAASEAQVMGVALQQEYGVRVRWFEMSSRNTRENARYSAQLLAPEGVATVVLVAHAADMPRAQAEFAAAGLTVIPAPTGLLAPLDGRLADFIPTPGALQLSHHALYEHAANFARALGR